MLAGGIPLAPVLVFIIASPLIKPSSFILTAGFLGYGFAGVKLVATMFIGLGIGYIAQFLSGKRLLEDQIRDSILAKHRKNPRSSITGRQQFQLRDWIRGYGRAVLRQSAFTSRYILLALVLQTLMVRYIPTTWISGSLGVDNLSSIPVAALIGIPFYVNNVAAPPLLKGLMELGMAPGAAMGFMITGTIYSAPSLIAISTMVRKKTVLLYLIVGLGGGLIAGYSYQAFLVLTS